MLHLAAWAIGRIDAPMSALRLGQRTAQTPPRRVDNPGVQTTDGTGPVRAPGQPTTINVKSSPRLGHPESTERPTVAKLGPTSTNSRGTDVMGALRLGPTESVAMMIKTRSALRLGPTMIKPTRSALRLGPTADAQRRNGAMAQSANGQYVDDRATRRER